MKHQNVTMTCPRCGGNFVLGKTGSCVRGGKASVCDRCQGNRRDENGWVIWAEDTEFVDETQLPRVEIGPSLRRVKR